MVALTAPNEDIVRKRFEQERSRKEKSNNLVRERLRVFSRIVTWLIAAFFMVMDYPFLLKLLDGYREGWVPVNLIVVFLVLIAGLIVSLALLIFWVWTSRKSNDG